MDTCCASFVMGIQTYVMILTLPSLCQKLDVSYELISMVKSFKIIPDILALVLVGILHDTYPFLVPYLLIGECVILSVSILLMSVTNSLWVFALLFFCQTGAMQALNNGCQWSILQIFKDHSAAKMQLYNLGYGIGAILGGLICRSFLPSNTSYKSIKLTKYCARIMNDTTNQTFITKTAAYNSFTEASQNTTTTNNFEYAFCIAAILDFIVPVIFGSYHFLIPRPPDVLDYAVKKKEPLSRSLNPKYFSPNRPKFGIFMAILLFLFYFTYVTGVFTLTPFLAVFATDPCKPYAMSQQSSATLAMGVNFAFILGGVFSSFTVNINPLLFLLVHNIINVIALIFLSIFGNDYVLALWICWFVIRFMNGINFPGGTSTVNRYIVISGSFISLAFIGSSFGTMLGQNIGSIFIDNFPSIYHIYSGFIGMGSLLAVIVIMCVIGLIYDIRDFPKKQNDIEMSN